MTEVISTRLEKEQIRQIKAYAKAQERTNSWVLKKAIGNYIRDVINSDKSNSKGSKTNLDIKHD